MVCYKMLQTFMPIRPIMDNLLRMSPDTANSGLVSCFFMCVFLKFHLVNPSLKS